MLKKIASFFTAAIVLLGFSGCSMVVQDLIETEYRLEVPPKMVFLGDSIAAGYGLDGYTFDDNYNCDSYSNILRKQYTKELSEICSVDMQNFAVSGATSEDLLNLLESGKLDSALENADAVIVSIGGNDMLHVMFGLFAELGMSEENHTIDIDNINIFSAISELLSLDEDIDKALDGFEVNINKISEELNEKTDGVIYIQTLYNPFEALDIKMVADLGVEKVDKFNKIVKDNAENYEVIDIFEKFDGRNAELTRMKQMDIHPNEKGHELIAETVDETFRKRTFTYILQEYSEPHLSLTAVLLIFSAFAATFIVLFFIMKPPKKDDKDEFKIKLEK